MLLCMTRTFTKADLISFLKEQPNPVRKKAIADAFSIRGDERVLLKKILRELEAGGHIIKHPGGRFGPASSLPDVVVIEITGQDEAGDVVAIPAQWDEHENGPRPSIIVTEDQSTGKAGDQSPSYPAGLRALARVHRTTQGDEDAQCYEATILRRLDNVQSRLMGVVQKARFGYTLKPVSKKAKFDFDVVDRDLNGAKAGDIVIAEIQPQQGRERRAGGHGAGRIRKKARVIETLGRQDDPQAISRISLHEEGLREEFTAPVLQETAGMKVPGPKGREDLRHVPLVTIDGEDSRDFDDAVFARKLDDQSDPNSKGAAYHLIVAIADVAHYVRPGSKLDIEAWTRGNSTYFPDKVVPMLPETLSNDLCSLRPGEDRASLAVHLWIGADGALKNYKFSRALIRSKARLTYNQVQDARNGQADSYTAPLIAEVISPLYEAYHILKKARDTRGALDLDLPERQIMIDSSGRMTGVQLRERLDAHMLIEEFMVLANVAAATALEARQAPCIYRIHEQPSADKLSSAQNFIAGFGVEMKRGKISRAGQLNALLKQVVDHPCKDIVHEAVLRSQSAAIYAPENIGHFGLDLEKYAHFTSPIRRYSDLVVHRSLIRAYGLGPGGLDEDEEHRIAQTCHHISETERASMVAERNAVDRFAASYLVHQPPGQIYTGKIKSVTGFGLFVRLDETGVDGLVPVRTLGGDYFIYDEEHSALIGERTAVVFRLGGEVQVKLAEADPITGSATFEILNPENGADIHGFELEVKPKKRRRPQRPFRKGGHKSSGNKNRHKKTRQRGGKSSGS